MLAHRALRLCMLALVAALLLCTSYTQVSADDTSSSSSGASNGTDSNSTVPVLPIDVSTFWGGCAPYAIHGAATVSFASPASTVHVGDVGVSPSADLTGFPANLILGDGTAHFNDAHAVLCFADKKGIFNYLHGLTCPADHVLDSADLSGRTLFPGVWCGSTMEFSAATLTLDGQGDPNAQFVFQTASTLNTATATSFILINGAKACNIFWAIGTSATLGYDSDFVGHIVSYASISLAPNVRLTGRALALVSVTSAGLSDVSLPEQCVPTPDNSTDSSSSSSSTGPEEDSSSSSSSSSSSTGEQESSSSSSTGEQEDSSSSSSTGEEEETDSSSSSSSSTGEEEGESSSSSSSSTAEDERESSSSSSTGEDGGSIDSSSSSSTGDNAPDIIPDNNEGDDECEGDACSAHTTQAGLTMLYLVLAAAVAHIVKA